MWHEAAHLLVNCLQGCGESLLVQTQLEQLQNKVWGARWVLPVEGAGELNLLLLKRQQLYHQVGCPAVVCVALL